MDKGAIYLLVLTLIYFLPAAVAWDKKHKNVNPIFLLNLLLGWTFLGWVAALIWSFTSNVMSEEEKVAKKLEPVSRGLIVLGVFAALLIVVSTVLYYSI